MRRIIALAALVVAPALAADDQKTQELQVQLQVCKQQRNEAQDAIGNNVAPLLVQIERLQARVKELEGANKK